MEASPGARFATLLDFLMVSFTPGELETFLVFRGLEDVADGVNRHLPVREAFLEIVRMLDQRGLIDYEFFQGLIREHPALEGQIRSLRESWLGEDRTGGNPTDRPTSAGSPPRDSTGPAPDPSSASPLPDDNTSSFDIRDAISRAIETGRIEQVVRVAREMFPDDAVLKEAAGEILGDDNRAEAAWPPAGRRDRAYLLPHLAAIVQGLEAMAAGTNWKPLALVADTAYMVTEIVNDGVGPIAQFAASRLDDPASMKLKEFADALFELFLEPGPLDHADRRAEATSRLLTRLVKLVPEHAAHAFEAGVALDSARIRRAVRLGRWTDETPVASDFFGPLWPWGEPEWRMSGAEPGAGIAAAAPPSYRVLVVGQGTYDLPAVVHEASRQLGQALAAAGLGLITGVFPGVDYLVSEAMQRAVRERGLDETRWITQHFATSVPPDFRRGRSVESKDSAASMRGSVGDADVVVLISGFELTREIATLALDAGKPVLPIAATGGTAEHVFRSTFAAWDQRPVGTLGIHEYLLLSLPVPTSVDQVIRLIDRLVGRHATSPAALSPAKLTADHLAIAASCWRAPKFDAKYGRPMYRFDVVLVCPDEWLGRVESVEYFLDGSWPQSSTPKTITTRANRFKFKELTWGDSVTVRAKVRVRDQDAAVELECSFERSENGPRL